MVQRVEIKDKDKQIELALKAIGYNVDCKSVEVILNVVDFIRENKSETTLLDIKQIKEMVFSLYDV